MKPSSEDDEGWAFLALLGLKTFAFFHNLKYLHYLIKFRLIRSKGKVFQTFTDQSMTKPNPYLREAESVASSSSLHHFVESSG